MTGSEALVHHCGSLSSLDQLAFFPDVFARLAVHVQVQVQGCIASGFEHGNTQLDVNAFELEMA